MEGDTGLKSVSDIIVFNFNMEVFLSCNLLNMNLYHEQAVIILFIPVCMYFMYLIFHWLRYCHVTVYIETLLSIMSLNCKTTLYVVMGILKCETFRLFHVSKQLNGLM